jgi:AcrR family transcriptional regulator
MWYMYHMGQTPRQRLLDAVVAHLAEHGLGDTSLRGLAAAAGTSHRMLSYHFGSRARLLTEVSKAVEERQRAALATMLADPDASPIDVIRGMWRRIADPSLHPQERLFFELYARALQGGAEAEGFLPEVVEAWIAPSAELFARLGLSDADARAEARLALAVARGLLLDLLATGDRDAVDAAIERYVARFASDGVRPLGRSGQDPQQTGERAT